MYEENKSKDDESPVEEPRSVEEVLNKSPLSERGHVDELIMISTEANESHEAPEQQMEIVISDESDQQDRIKTLVKNGHSAEEKEEVLNTEANKSHEAHKQQMEIAISDENKETEEPNVVDQARDDIYEQSNEVKGGTKRKSSLNESENKVIRLEEDNGSISFGDESMDSVLNAVADQLDADRNGKPSVMNADSSESPSPGSFTSSENESYDLLGNLPVHPVHNLSDSETESAPEPDTDEETCAMDEQREEENTDHNSAGVFNVADNGEAEPNQPSSVPVSGSIASPEDSLRDFYRWVESCFAHDL